MQPLLFQVATTFIGDAVAFVNGFGRIVTHILMAPVERIAKACDVAGILGERAARAAERERVKHAWHSLSQKAPRPHRPHRHRSLFGCLRSLGELT
ncbi:MAG TPA: hypothetical protein VID30_08595 [Bradyrhizobium sp.]|jgi:hypothetical protein